MPRGVGVKSEGVSDVWRISVWTFSVLVLPEAHIPASCSAFVLKGSKAEILIGISHSFLEYLNFHVEPSCCGPQIILFT